MLSLLKKPLRLLSVVLFSSLLHTYPINGCGSCANKINIENDSIGNTISVWSQHDHEEGKSTVLSSFQLIGNAWTKPIIISRDSPSNIDPIIEISNDDSVICVWLTVHLDKMTNNLMASSLDSIGGTWSDPILISDENESVINGWYNLSVTGKNVSCIWGSYTTDPDTGILIRTIRTSNGIIGEKWTAPTTLY